MRGDAEWECRFILLNPIQNQKRAESGKMRNLVIEKKECVNIVLIYKSTHSHIEYGKGRKRIACHHVVPIVILYMTLRNGMIH